MANTAFTTFSRSSRSRRVSSRRPEWNEILRNASRWMESLRDAHARHDAARVVIRSHLQSVFNGWLHEDGMEPLLKLTSIDAGALTAWEMTWNRASNLDGGWNWKGVAKKMRRRVARVDLAIWYEDQLCGLAYGRLSDRRNVVRIDLVERKPGDCHLKGWIALIVAEAATTTAQAYGARVVRFHNPVPGARHIYEGLGFRYVALNNTIPYCEKELSDDPTYIGE